MRFFFFYGGGGGVGWLVRPVREPALCEGGNLQIDLEGVNHVQTWKINM